MNLGNVISSSYKADKKTAFLTMEDHILLEKIGVAAFELQVQYALRLFVLVTQHKALF